MLCRAPRDGEEELQRQSSLPECKSHGPPIGSCMLRLKTLKYGRLLLQTMCQPQKFPRAAIQGGWMDGYPWLAAPSCFLGCTTVPVSPRSPWPPCSGQLIFWSLLGTNTEDSASHREQVQLTAGCSHQSNRLKLIKLIQSN